MADRAYALIKSSAYAAGLTDYYVAAQSGAEPRWFSKRATASMRRLGKLFTDGFDEGGKGLPHEREYSRAQSRWRRARLSS